MSAITVPGIMSGPTEAGDEPGAVRKFSLIFIAIAGVLSWLRGEETQGPAR
jgi:hypothetical protein